VGTVVVLLVVSLDMGSPIFFTDQPTDRPDRPAGGREEEEREDCRCIDDDLPASLRRVHAAWVLLLMGFCKLREGGSCLVALAPAPMLVLVLVERAYAVILIGCLAIILLNIRSMPYAASDYHLSFCEAGFGLICFLR
jgi:hypothetical protein